MSNYVIRAARPGDEPGAYYICLKTGNLGEDGEPLYRDDPDALGRIFVGPYLMFERELSVILEDEQGMCGYALGALDSRVFYARYETEWRPRLCAQFSAPAGEPQHWTPVQTLHHEYHYPEYFYPEPYEAYPSHLHIDLLPRAQGRGYGRRMLERVMDMMRRSGSTGVHLGVNRLNTRARAFYDHLGFRELTRTGTDQSGSIYLVKTLSA